MQCLSQFQFWDSPLYCIFWIVSRARLHSCCVVLIPTNCLLQAKTLGNHCGVLHPSWGKMTLSGGILEGNTGKLKNNLIITMKCFSPCPGLVTSLPLGEHGWIVGPYVIVVSAQDNSFKMATVVVVLVNLKEIREGIIHIPSQVLRLHCVPGDVCELWLHDIVQGESLYPIMSGQV